MDIFSICEFKTDPATAYQDLGTFLRAGMPPNVLLGAVREDADETQKQNGLLHVICRSATVEQQELAGQLVDLLFEFGSSWMLVDGFNKTPGCIARDRGLLDLYRKFVQAGVRSEIFLRRMTEDDEPEETNAQAQLQQEQHQEPQESGQPRKKARVVESKPDENQDDYLASNLEYSNNTLVTDQQDGVMMDWETPIMKRSAEIITRPERNVLNVGFGMGIIDGFIQELGPGKHYICEAHPEVLAKMRADGWFDKPNVVVLEGPWKQTLPKLLSQGVTFAGIYYDTFSEHYTDMLEFFDLVCGLLDFDGVFSFFNGLGADRQIVYDVYKEVVEFDVKEFGFDVVYEMMPVEMPKTTWDGIKRAYFVLDEYALPKITFMS